MPVSSVKSLYRPGLAVIAVDLGCSPKPKSNALSIPTIPTIFLFINIIVRRRNNFGKLWVYVYVTIKMRFKILLEKEVLYKLKHFVFK